MINPEKITATEAENEKLKTEISRLEQENSELRTLNNWYVEQFKLAQHLRFGASSEKQVLPGQMKLFNEAEVIADSSPPEPVLEETVIRKRKKRSGKRDELYYGLPTEQRVHELPVEDRICPICGGNLHACGHETLRRELEVVPASIKAVEHIQTVYSCRACEQSEDSELAVPMIKSEVPKPVIAGSGIASPSLLAFVLSNKYVLALPLSRQEQEFKRQDIVISRQNMANWCIYVAMHWLMPIYTLLKNVFLAFTNNHADETVLQVINEPGRKATTNSYFWVYLTGFYAEHQVVLFEYTETRAGKHPLKFLEGYTGTLNVDAYQGYYALEDKGVTLVGCWTHVRRKFVDVLKTMPKHQHENHPATKGLAYCDQLFALERKFDEHNLTPAERHERRQIESKPVTTALFAWANNLLLALPGKSKLREAVVYVVNQQHRLSNFLLDGHIEISNNRAERSIIPFAVGRNNWMFAYSPKGAAASAIIYSIAETAKANGLVPFKYFEFLFETLPNIPKEQFSDCLPWNPSVIERCKAPT
jgi:transposase